jgi:hypothetical protein
VHNPAVNITITTPHAHAHENTPDHHHKKHKLDHHKHYSEENSIKSLGGNGFGIKRPSISNNDYDIRKIIEESGEESYADTNKNSCRNLIQPIKDDKIRKSNSHETESNNINTDMYYSHTQPYKFNYIRSNTESEKKDKSKDEYFGSTTNIINGSGSGIINKISRDKFKKDFLLERNELTSRRSENITNPSTNQGRGSQTCKIIFF